MAATLAFIGTIGTSQILFILLIIMLLFGAAKIPELARSLGKAQREFQKARDEMDRELHRPAPKTATAPAATGKGPDHEVPAAEKAQVLLDAHALGLETQGKTLEELKAAVAEAQATHPPKE